MFSKGQLIFAICFIVLFILALIVSYRKDKEQRKKHYRGTFKILLGFIAFILSIVLIKYMLK